MAAVDLKHLCGKCADAYRCKDKRDPAVVLEGRPLIFCSKYSPKVGAQ
jgi:hypothetical protein